MNTNTINTNNQDIWALLGVERKLTPDFMREYEALLQLATTRQQKIGEAISKIKEVMAVMERCYISKKEILSILGETEGPSELSLAATPLHTLDKYEKIKRSGSMQLHPKTGAFLLYLDNNPGIRAKDIVKEFEVLPQNVYTWIYGMNKKYIMSEGRKKSITILPLGKKYLEECIKNKIIEPGPNIGLRYKSLFIKSSVTKTALIMKGFVSPASVKEAAERLGMPIKTVASWVYNNVNAPNPKIQKIQGSTKYILTENGKLLCS